MNDTPEPTYPLEQNVRFSESIIWQLQRGYFEEQGVAAWQNDSIPHYITGNPTLARAYAEITIGFLRDRYQRGASTDETLYFVELGGGTGRFAYRFIKVYTDLLEQAGFPVPPFCYVITDMIEKNVTFWREHPRFQPFIEQGLVDFALFDATTEDPIHLQMSGHTLDYHSTNQPLVIIANYFFDSIDQDLFYILDGNLCECRVNVVSHVDPATNTPGDLTPHIDIDYVCQTITPPYYNIPYLDDVLTVQTQTFSETYLLFPHKGIQCLHHLPQMSTAGLMLLSGDKGDHRIDALDNRGAPAIVMHGSFSLTVNYHALAGYCEQHGGVAMFADSHHYHLNVPCFLMLPDADTYTETRYAFNRAVDQLSPDDLYNIIKHFERSGRIADLSHILGYLRLSGHDAVILMMVKDRLLKVLPQASANERKDVFAAIQKVWDLYYSIGEAFDLAFELALLLFEIEQYETALLLFNHSIKTHGIMASTLHNITACYDQLGNTQMKNAVLDQLRAFDPTFIESTDSIQSTSGNSDNS